MTKLEVVVERQDRMHAHDLSLTILYMVSVYGILIQMYLFFAQNNNLVDFCDFCMAETVFPLQFFVFFSPYSYLWDNLAHFSSNGEDVTCLCTDKLQHL